MVNAMDWLYSQEEFNTKEKRGRVEELIIDEKNLEGHLDLREFVNLTKLGYPDNKLTSIDVSKNVNLTKLFSSGNKLTSIDFLNQLPNPEKLETLIIFDNKIQPTDIAIFSKFINLEELMIGTTEESLKKGKHNKFYGSLKSYQNLTKLERICIEATDVNEGLEYLPESLAKATKEGKYSNIECLPRDTNAKCSAIQNELRPFNYDIEAWQLANPDKMLTVWKEKYQDKAQLITKLETKIIQTQQELQTAKDQEADKTKKIERLETSLRLLEQTKTRLEQELAQEQQAHNQTKTNFQSQLRDLATILFPSNSNLSHLSFSILKEQAKEVKKEIGSQQKELINRNKEIWDLEKKHDKEKQSILNQAQKEQEILKEQKTSADQTITELQKQISVQHQELQTQLQALTKLQTEKQKAVQELTTKLNQTNTELTNSKNQLTKLQEQITTQTKTHQEQIKQLQSKITLLEQQKTTYQTKYDNSIEFIKEIKEDIAKM